MKRYVKQYKEEKELKEMTYPGTIGDLRHILYQIHNQEMTVRELRQAIFRMNDNIQLSDKILQKI